MSPISLFEGIDLKPPLREGLSLETNYWGLLMVELSENSRITPIANLQLVFVQKQGKSMKVKYNLTI